MEEIENQAILAMQNAYVPYSGYKVGAALVTKSGKVYTGCNIENGGIMSICAERVAFCKAISEGEKEFDKIIIVAEKNGVRDFATPCGYCRQFMSEFINEEFKIIVIGATEAKEYTIRELLPEAFKLSN